MPSHRRRKEAARIRKTPSHLSLSDRRPKSASPVKPKATVYLFATVFFSWVGAVALFLSQLEPIENAKAVISPNFSMNKKAQQIRLRAHINDADDKSSKTEPKQRQRARRDRSETGHGKVKKKSKAEKQTQAIQLLRKRGTHPNGEGGARNRHEHVRDALRFSTPYVQNHADASLPPAKSVHAFAAEKYWDETDMMGDDDDSLDTYYAVDDDAIRGKREENLDKRDGMCTAPTFYRLYRPTCNDVHSTVGGNQWLTKGVRHRRRSRYLGAGNYRNVFLLETPSKTGEVIYKSMKLLPKKDGRRTLEQRAAYNPGEVYKNFELYDDMRKDSMVMELLTSSRRIADIYSFCALTSFIEYAPGNIENYVTSNGEEKGDDDPTPINDHIGPMEKLEMALELAKGIATMHSYSGGVIANVDVQLGQFCRGRDGLIKVLDFNRAEVMMYDVERDEYCPFSNGVPPDGSFRAPEEIVDGPLDEKIDVYSLGNVFYTILTGLLVNRKYEVREAHWRITHGKTEEFDANYFKSRSPMEKALVEVIQWCWTFEAGRRPSIFQVVSFLEGEVQKNLEAREDISEDSADDASSSDSDI